MKDQTAVVADVEKKIADWAQKIADKKAGKDSGDEVGEGAKDVVMGSPTVAEAVPVGSDSDMPDLMDDGSGQNSLAAGAGTPDAEKQAQIGSDASAVVSTITAAGSKLNDLLANRHKVSVIKDQYQAPAFSSTSLTLAPALFCANANKNTASDDELYGAGVTSNSMMGDA